MHLIQHNMPIIIDEDEPGDSNDDNNEEDDDDYLDDDDFDVDLMLDNEHGVIGDLSGGWIRNESPSKEVSPRSSEFDNILDSQKIRRRKVSIGTANMEKTRDVALDSDGAYVTSRDQRSPCSSYPNDNPSIHPFETKTSEPKKSCLKLAKSVSERDTIIFSALKANVEALETKAETIRLEDHEISNRLSYLKQLDDLEHIKRLDLMQKAKIKWAIEGDENSKFFHGFINNSCGGGKAPGPDGFTFKFIKQYWEIGIDFINMVKRFEIDGEILRGCNSSFIALAPKIQDPLHIKDYRPISLIGCQYKVIAKVLANLLSKVVNSVVSEVQTTYIKGRQIIDGPLMANEIISWASKRHKQLFILKVDFEKAFDSLDWKFLDHVLEQMGDPLSSFLFIIAVEALHISLQVAKEINIFEGVEVSHNKIDILHLQFADDALIMGRWSLENAKNLCRILRCFQMASGLKVNFMKSKLFGTGVNISEVQNFTSTLKL
ncbi:RNA-directed DNA polymerase, eukaryota, reverse transcriptase zinc-binding domain protein [Tanacetum coccineum]